MAKKQFANNDNFKSVWLTCLIVFIFFALQHFLRRYGQPIPNIFLNVMNKSIAFTSFTMFSIALLIGSFVRIWPKKWESRVHQIKSFGILGFVLSFVHIIISVMMFSASYYPAYFTPENKMTAGFALSLLFGTAAFVYFMALSFNLLSGVIQKAATIKLLNGTMYVFLLGHIFILKYDELLDMNSWVHGIPSGHFVGMLITVVVIVFYTWSHISAEKRGQK